MESANNPTELAAIQNANAGRLKTREKQTPTLFGICPNPMRLVILIVSWHIKCSVKRSLKY